jgi:hypothetical protein
VLMRLGAMAPYRPLASLTQPVHPDTIMKHPTGRRMVNPRTRVMGKRGVMVFEPRFKGLG